MYVLVSTIQHEIIAFWLNLNWVVALWQQIFFGIFFFLGVNPKKKLLKFWKFFANIWNLKIGKKKWLHNQTLGFYNTKEVGDHKGNKTKLTLELCKTKVAHRGEIIKRLQISASKKIFHNYAIDSFSNVNPIPTHIFIRICTHIVGNDQFSIHQSTSPTHDQWINIRWTFTYTTTCPGCLCESYCNTKQNKIQINLFDQKNQSTWHHDYIVFSSSLLK